MGLPESGNDRPNPDRSEIARRRLCRGGRRPVQGRSRTRVCTRRSTAVDTWTKSKFIDDDTGFIDVVMDPSNSQILVAASYQRRRASWGFNGGGPGSALWKTIDGGKTWKRLEGGGLPPYGKWGRVGLAFSRSNPNILYAMIEPGPQRAAAVAAREVAARIAAPSSIRTAPGIWRSDDKGATWKLDEQRKRPGDVLQPDSRRSEGSEHGLRARAKPAQVHRRRKDVQDHSRRHPRAASRILLQTPSSLVAPFDRGPDDAHAAKPSGSPRDVDRSRQPEAHPPRTRWRRRLLVRRRPDLAAPELDADGAVLSRWRSTCGSPYFVYGGSQDNGVWGGPSRVRNNGGITKEHWFEVAAGDGFHVGRRSDRLEHRLHVGVGKRRSAPLAQQPAHRRAEIHQADAAAPRRRPPGRDRASRRRQHHHAARAERSDALQLEPRFCHVAARSARDLFRRQPAVHVARSWRQLDRHQGFDQGAQSGRPADHGRRAARSR